MNFHRRRLVDEPEINVISMVDLVLVILLFFMVSTTFTRPGILKLNLPTASSSAAIPEKARILIDMNAAGQIVVNGQPLPLSALARHLRSISSNSGQAVYLRADRNSTQQQIVMVLDAARQAGLSRISIGTLKAP